MKVHLESTDQIVELETAHGRVSARIWEGTTDNGIACHAFITRMAVHQDLDASQFAHELEECRPLSPALHGIYATRMGL